MRTWLRKKSIKFANKVCKNQLPIKVHFSAINESEAAGDVTHVLSAFKIPIVGDRHLEVQQWCQIVLDSWALCDLSTSQPNSWCSRLIMSHFKVEKGRISRYICNFLHRTWKYRFDLIAFARQERVLFWLQAMEIFLRLILCLFALFNSYQSERAYRSFGQS